jgi:hypothetical protein
MRRAGGLWERVVALPNLLAAARRAARGKREQAGVARFICDLEPQCLALERALREGSYRPGAPTTFTILDPKERTISAAPFRDRVLHHALMAVLEPVFERRMTHESFACRRGKGTHAALAHARRLVRRFGWFLKLDIAKCFESLDHEVILETVRRVVKDRRVLALLETIVRGGGVVTVEGRRVGLPIGNLTSQWLANLVLDRLDHFVKEDLRVPGFARYMDDFVLFGDAKDTLRAVHERVQVFVRDTLRLRLKERATILAPAAEGLPFLGFRIYRGTLRLRPENLRRTRARIRRREWEFRTGRIGARALADSIRSVTTHLSAGSTLSLRRSLFAAREGGGSDAARNA